MKEKQNTSSEMADARPAVSVIVVNYNTKELLDTCLTRLQNSREVSYEIIVVDNGSTDGSVPVLQEQYPDVQVIEFSRNEGYARAINAGVNQACGELLTFVNTDTAVTPGTLAGFYRFKQQIDGPVGCMGPVLVEENGSVQNSWAPFPSLFGELINRSLAKAIYKWKQDIQVDYQMDGDSTASPDGIEVPSLVGACMAVPREVWEEVGAFDESYFVFLEETDWCKRAVDQGYQCYLLPDIQVTHLQGKTRELSPSRGRVEFFRSLYRYFEKHSSPLEYRLLRILNPLRLTLEMMLNAIGTVCSFGLKARWKRKLQTGFWLVYWHVLFTPFSMGLAEEEQIEERR